MFEQSPICISGPFDLLWASNILTYQKRQLYTSFGLLWSTFIFSFLFFLFFFAFGQFRLYHPPFYWWMTWPARHRMFANSVFSLPCKSNNNIDSIRFSKWPDLFLPLWPLVSWPEVNSWPENGLNIDFSLKMGCAFLHYLLLAFSLTLTASLMWLSWIKGTRIDWLSWCPL